MSFIYRAPLNLLVSARSDSWPLRFNETASLLLKYVDHDHATSHRLDEDAKSACRKLPISGVFRSDGTTQLDLKWWEISDLGAVATPQRNAHVRAARLDFRGVAFSDHVAAKEGRMGIEDVALHDAFVEQDSIQLLVKLRDAQLGECEAALVLKLTIDGQGRSPHPPRGPSAHR